jgi:hypothetical protein
MKYLSEKSIFFYQKNGKMHRVSMEKIPIIDLFKENHEN